MKKLIYVNVLLSLLYGVFFFSLTNAKEVSGGPINATCTTGTQSYDVGTTPALNAFTLSSIATTLSQNLPGLSISITQALITCEGGGNEGYGVCHVQTNANGTPSTVFVCPASDRNAPVVNLIDLPITTTFGTYCEEVTDAADSVSQVSVIYTKCT